MQTANGHQSVAADVPFRSAVSFRLSSVTSSSSSLCTGSLLPPPSLRLTSLSPCPSCAIICLHLFRPPPSSLAPSMLSVAITLLLWLHYSCCQSSADTDPARQRSASALHCQGRVSGSVIWSSMHSSKWMGEGGGRDRWRWFRIWFRPSRK